MKRLFNFYLDDDIKKKANDKLTNLLGETTKGALAALIRVQLEKFIEEQDPKVLTELAANVLNNYMECQFSNKRSKL